MLESWSLKHCRLTFPIEEIAPGNNASSAYFSFHRVNSKVTNQCWRDRVWNIAVRPLVHRERPKYPLANSGKDQWKKPSQRAAKMEKANTVPSYESGREGQCSEPKDVSITDRLACYRLWANNHVPWRTVTVWGGNKRPQDSTGAYSGSTKLHQLRSRRHEALCGIVYAEPSRLDLTAGQRPSLSCQGDTSLPRRTTNQCHPSLASNITRHDTDRTCLGNTGRHIQGMNPALQNNA
ncbi:hypothetical protein PoB_003743300 [Plakobranchus ocellatus]|uniref:Uncharacterized protein n=1 Tax=Plakobranchus ocellatus TaxID=259542 RepID=A0AAV4AU53_9GAST|nr:hypothetical protein PoB_003743300 [Plakobranchus ocellatus]